MQIKELSGISEQLRKANVELVVIGSGSSSMAAKFRQEFPFTGELYIDPKLASYSLFKLPRGKWETFRPSINAVKMAVSQLKGETNMSSVQGDALQQGGLFIVGPGAQSLYSHINQHTGDHADIQDVVKFATQE